MPSPSIRLAIFVSTCVLACAVAPSTDGHEPEPERAAAPPNVVLVMADDQGWGELSARGHPWLETPGLDALMQDGVSFEQFRAAAPVCSPTRGSVLTGRHPNRYGCLAWGHEIPADEVTLAELLRERGYATGHFGKWHVGSTRRGEPTCPGVQGFDVWHSAPNFFDLDPLLSENGRVVETHGEGSEIVVERALRFIEESRDEGRPFFAVLWFGSPHDPHHGTPADLEALDGIPEPLRAYAAEFRALDRSVGRLRNQLTELGLSQDTILWYTSDNGPRPPDEGQPGDRSTAGLRGRKGSLWEGGVRVPSLLEWPGRLEGGRRLDVASGTVDILPTVLGMAGLDPPAGLVLDGVDLAPALQDPDWGRPPMGFWTVPAPGRAMHSDRILQAQRDFGPPLGPPPRVPLGDDLPGAAAWVDGPWKLHRRPAAARSATTS
jgi:arylsulfatase A-like enzyme